MRKKFTSTSVRKTLSFARAFAQELKPGSVVALEGDLGSGKTTFIKGIALGLGLKDSDEVKSPTFTLMNIYPAKVPVYHFDLYRLENLRQIQAIGFEEYIHDPNAISCIEWAGKAKALLPPAAFHVSLQVTGEKSRLITVQPKRCRL